MGHHSWWSPFLGASGVQKNWSHLGETYFREIIVFIFFYIYLPPFSGLLSWLCQLGGSEGKTPR